MTPYTSRTLSAPVGPNPLRLQLLRYSAATRLHPAGRQLPGGLTPTGNAAPSTTRQSRVRGGK